MGTNGKYNELARRMKNYEDVYRFKLPRRAYTLMRIDGKAFHTYTKGLERPFDDGLIEDMDETAKYLCKNIMGAKLAYVQSDEISILITDFEQIETEAWFDNNLQKMATIAASMATAKFNQLRLVRYAKKSGASLGYINIDDINKFKIAEFDARIWQIPQKVEVMNYFLWRQQDCTRNSISTVAQSLYSSNELRGVNSSDKQELIFQKGINWNDYDPKKKRGRIIEKITYVNGVDRRHIMFGEIAMGDVVRNKWESIECPIFSQDKHFLDIRIPDNK